MKSILAPHLEMGAVELNVKNLEAEKYFYTQLVGLEEMAASSKSVTLGWGRREILKLHATPQLSTAALGSAGLYHLAIVFESRSALSLAVKNILEQDPELYSGTADHLVSEAFYFTDPEGNGVELYFDRNPSTWQWHDGTIIMASIYIDPEEYIATHLGSLDNAAKKIGHVHLKIGAVADAKKFYVDTLGFATTFEMPTALFLSDGKYHHHLGMNIWESARADKRNESLGLHSFEIILPSNSDLRKLQERLSSADVQFTSDKTSLKLNDPWNNTLILTSKVDHERSIQ